jgi:orotate phosphoribosyltransferase
MAPLSLVNLSLSRVAHHPIFLMRESFIKGLHWLHWVSVTPPLLLNQVLNLMCFLAPAYKGITLAAATSIALSEHHGIDVPYCFNRKEAKVHGEGGTLVGAPLEGKVLIIDDVITAGTAIREVMSILEQAGAVASGVLIGLDRKERGKTDQSAIQEVEKQFGIPVASIIDIDDIMHYLKAKPDHSNLVEQIDKYRQQYGV